MELREPYPTMLTLHRPVGLPGQVELDLTNNTITAIICLLAKKKKMFLVDYLPKMSVLWIISFQIWRNKAVERGCLAAFSLNCTGLCKLQKKKKNWLKNTLGMRATTFSI